MPYARPRTRPALNKAYAHATETETGMAANALADRLIDGMGLAPLDLASLLAPQLPLGLPEDGPLFQQLQAQLARHQYPLVQRLALRIAELRDQAGRSAFQQLVLDGGWTLEAGPEHAFRFDPAVYPVPGHQRYRGKFQFSKHFYPVLACLDDGGEEWRCAMALDEQPAVRHWVRNLDSDPVAGIWLPTSGGRFYPDFVAELMDGRVLVAEYKGAQIRHMPKELEKAQVGRLWAQRSGGRAVFAMVYLQGQGMGMAQQIAAALA